MKVDKLFENFSPLMKEKGPELVKKVGHTYHFEIQKEKGDTNPAVWTIDLKNGSGSVKKGREGTADATFTLTDADAAGLFDGSLKPNTLFMQGKMKIKGNMQAAMKFTPDLFPKSPKL